MTTSDGPPDAELVARVLDADRDAFATVYDRYSDRLFDFAYSMLRHREDAADAVADSFILFAERLPQLREPDRLRPWLYAIVRSECLRRLKARKRVAYGDEEQLIEMADDSITPERSAETRELQQLVWDASAGLADRDRALLDLHLRHGLEGAALGEAMGVSADNAYVMLNRVKAQVDRSLGALLIARLGRDDCSELDSLLADWDGTFSPLVRKRVARHVDNCEVCGDRRKKALSPLALLAAVPLFVAPLSLRDRVLSDTQLVAWTGADAGIDIFGGTAVGTQVAAGAGDVAVETVAPRRRGRMAGAGLAAAALIAAAIAVWPSDDTDDPQTIGATQTPTASASPSPDPEPTPSDTPSPSTSAEPSPSPSPTAPTTSASPQAGRLSVSASAVNFGTRATSLSFRVTNVGGQPLTFSTSPSASWIGSSPSTSSLQPDGGATVRVTANRAALSEGDSRGAVRISWAGGSATVQVTAKQERSPVIGRPSVPSGQSCDNVPVAVRISEESGLRSVRVVWSGPSGGGSKAMTGSGANWGTTIGRFEVGGNVSIRVYATDSRGNSSVGPATSVFIAPCPQ